MNRYTLHLPPTKRIYPLLPGDRVKFTEKYIAFPTGDPRYPQARGTIVIAAADLNHWIVKWDIETGLGERVPMEIVEHE